MLLAYFLREDLGLTGTHVGCDTSSCGCCVVALDGDRAVKSCTMFAVQADGHEVTTVEGLEQAGKLHPLQQAFWDQHGLQCGYCTPGMLMTSLRDAQTQPAADRTGDPRAISGNLCRCTGYQNIVKAVSRPPKPFDRPRRDRHRRESISMTKTTDGPATSRHRRRDEAQGGSALHSRRGRYLDDIKLPNMLYLALVHSPYPHARIKSIDKSKAMAMPGVKAVITGEDLVAAKLAWLPTFHGYDKQMVLAFGKALFQYQEVAGVVATSREIAVDGAELVEVEYEPLDPISDPYQAAKIRSFCATTASRRRITSIIGRSATRPRRRARLRPPRFASRNGSSRRAATPRRSNPAAHSRT